MTSTFTPLFHSLLKLYHYFPLHSPATLFVVNGSWGRFASQGGKRRLYLDGNRAWAAMEIVSVSKRQVRCRRIFESDFVGNTAAIDVLDNDHAQLEHLDAFNGEQDRHGQYRCPELPILCIPAESPTSPSVDVPLSLFDSLPRFPSPPRSPSRTTTPQRDARCHLFQPDERVHGGLVHRLGSCRGGCASRMVVPVIIDRLGRRVGGKRSVVSNAPRSRSTRAHSTCRIVYHDEILHSLRGRSLIFTAFPFLRPRTLSDPDRTLTKGGNEQDGDKTYEIPVGGLFHRVTFPNYLCEWYVVIRLMPGSDPMLTMATCIGSSGRATPCSPRPIPCSKPHRPRSFLSKPAPNTRVRHLVSLSNSPDFPSRRPARC